MSPVQGLDGPLLADVAGQAGGVRPFRFRAGDAERGDGRDRLAAQVDDVPLDQEDLGDVRERELFGGGQDLDGAGDDPPVALSVAECATWTYFQAPGRRLYKGLLGSEGCDLCIDGFESLNNRGGSEILNHLPCACGNLET